ncbi:MAG TPA: hypothetical protein PKY95_05240, partial [candidate division Zixibacteria bacterium]|nr:hypothetical protein [candidate division Zixibacteria bacterium]
MSKCLAFACLYLCTASAAFGAPETGWETFRPDRQVQFDRLGRSTDTCLLFRHNPDDSVLGYSSSFTAGQQTIVYFDPTSCAADSTYPFGITELSFTLLDPPSYIDSRLYKWPVELEVVVYALAPTGDPCDGPGALLCSVSAACDSAYFAFPQVGTVPLPSPCCFDAPFFIGIRYTDTTSLRLPSIMWATDSSPALCAAFQFYDT